MLEADLCPYDTIWSDLCVSVKVYNYWSFLYHKRLWWTKTFAYSHTKWVKVRETHARWQPPSSQELSMNHCRWRTFLYLNRPTSGPKLYDFAKGLWIHSVANRVTSRRFDLNPGKCDQLSIKQIMIRINVYIADICMFVYNRLPW